MARVTLTSDAKEDLRDLDGSAQELVLKGLKKLETEPLKHGAPLGTRPSGDLTGFRRQRSSAQRSRTGTAPRLWLEAPLSLGPQRRRAPRRIRR